MSEVAWPCQPKADGSCRRLGFELEFVGLPLDKACTLLAEHYGGQARQLTKYRYQVETAHGAFVIELDVQLMHKLSAHHGREVAGDENYFLEKTAEALLNPVISRLGPCEIVTPPLEPSHIADLESLVVKMRAAGAQGTGAGLLHAFGLHVNIDPPSLDAPTLLAYLQSFVLLQDWLVLAMRMDMTRRIASFAKLFPESYAAHILADGYAPSLEGLIDDYLAYNPTRNRAVDFLPLFAWIDEARLTAAVPDSLVKKRPAFHLRMPNCRVDEAGWTVMGEIAAWQRVEQLAANHELRRQMIPPYLANMNRLLHHFDRSWEEQVPRWFETA